MVGWSVPDAAVTKTAFSTRVTVRRVRPGRRDVVFHVVVREVSPVVLEWVADRDTGRGRGYG